MITGDVEIGTEVRRYYTIAAKYLGLPKGSPPARRYDVGTVVEVNGERLRVLWHTYRVGSPSPQKCSPRRTWVNRKFLDRA
jgi:hypothetical protein